MALDSRQKRAAVIGVGRAWYRNAHPSSVNAAQRASIAQVYPVAVFQGVTAPVFAGTIPDLEYDKDTGTHVTDTSTYFTGATSYSISPAVEAGWSFNTSTGVLTVDTDAVDAFGPYTVTGTNSGGSDSSNAFNVTVSLAADFTGGFWFDYDREIKRKHDKRKELQELEAKAEQIQNDLDKKLALEIQQDQQDKARLKELNRLVELAETHEKAVTQLGEKVTTAYKRAIIKHTYSSMEALERTIRQAREEEDFLIRATMELLH